MTVVKPYCGGSRHYACRHEQILLVRVAHLQKENRVTLSLAGSPVAYFGHARDDIPGKQADGRLQPSVGTLAQAVDNGQFVSLRQSNGKYTAQR